MKRRVIYQIEFREFDSDRVIMGECYSDQAMAIAISHALGNDKRIAEKYEVMVNEVSFLDTEGGSNGTKS
jgi:hypothetical protein